MKYPLITLVLLLVTQLYAQTDTAIVNSDNGLSIRNAPSLKAERIGVIPYKKKVRILQSSKEFEQIVLSEEKQVVGEWKKISYKDLEGYVFDKFLTYETDYKHNNYHLNRKYIDIYTEKEFFDNIGDKRTLNIKVKKLDLNQYGKDNFNTLSKYNFNKRQTNGKGIEVVESYDDKYRGLILIRVNDLEITSEGKSILSITDLQIEKCEGVTFNNLTFINEEASEASSLINVEESEQIYFTNIDFNLGYFYANPDADVHMKYCDFNQYLLRLHDSQVSVEKCKFHNAEMEIIDILPTEENEYTTTLKVSDSFIGFNTDMVDIIEIEEYMENPFAKLNLLFDENNIIKHNPKYENIQILVPFKP